MICMKLNTEKRSLKSFGYTFTILIPLFFIFLGPFIFKIAPNYYSIIIALLFLFLTIVKPEFLKWPYVLWMYFGSFINYFKTFIILSVLYILVFIPIGVILNLVGLIKYVIFKDPTSYWVCVDENEDVKNMRYPF